MPFTVFRLAMPYRGLFVAYSAAVARFTVVSCQGPKEAQRRAIGKSDETAEIVEVIRGYAAALPLTFAPLRETSNAAP